MRLYSNSIKDGQPMPQAYALGVPDAENHAKFGQNLNPHLGWDDLPAGTRSLALICRDPDAPSRPDDVNQEGRDVPADLPRVDFFHWVVVDISPELKEIREAEHSQGVVQRGKPGPHGAEHTRIGLNSYTDWFKGDPDMEGHYYGYDGPFPPWNDAIPHRYEFTLYATDLERCPLGEVFTAAEVLEAIQGHVLAQAQLTCSYSLNPEVSA